MPTVIGYHDVADTEHWLASPKREEIFGPLGVGYVQASVDVASGVADIAWVIGARFQRRGYAREAASVMVSWLRGKGVISVTAHIHPDNRPSESVARAIGLAPRASMKDGEVRWSDQ
jgi:RimJ/RimL family protein N-acetyltransferase